VGTRSVVGSTINNHTPPVITSPCFQPGGVSKSSPSATAEDPTLTVAQCMCVIHDSEELSQQVSVFYVALR
jgi:hypothetical protein